MIFKNQLDTSTWKTYRNEEKKYELKYPGNWYIWYIVPSRISSEPETTRLHGAAFSRGAWIDISDSETGTCADTKNEYFVTDPPGRFQRTVCMGDKEIDLYIWKVVPINTEFIKIFNQILSTFKFIESSVSAQEIPEKLVCNTDNDCVLWLCAGALNKQWAKSAPPDLPCMMYQGYTAKCIEQKCTAVK